VRKTGAALEATTLQHSAASFRCHALDKAMYTGAVALLWLIGSFWHTAFTLAHPLIMDKWPFMADSLRLLITACYFLICWVKITMFNPDSLPSFPRFAKYFPQFSR